MIILLLCVILSGVSVQEAGKNTHYDPDFSAALAHITADESHVFLYDSVFYCPFPLIDQYGIFQGQLKGGWKNLIRVGNWDVEHPVKKQQLAKLGIDSPISSLATDGRVKLLSANSADGANKAVERYVTFFREHYDLNVKYEIEYRYGKYAIYQFYLASD